MKESEPRRFPPQTVIDKPEVGVASESSSRLRREIVTSTGRLLKVTTVFDTYWRFAAARQEIFMRRLEGIRPPWSDDPILSTYRFTNPYRASDRVSQYMIRHVLYDGDRSIEEVFFRALLFRLFNKVETWERLDSVLGPLTWGDFDYGSYVEVLDAATGSGQRIYSGAYIIPSPRFGSQRKHHNQLKLLERMMNEGVPHRVRAAGSFLEVFDIIRSYPSFGNFLSFQFSIDLNYSEILEFSENEFVVAGPGAQAGIRKCFSDMGGASYEEVIQTVAEVAKGEFERLDLTFKTLWGRELHLVDYQNLFCEVDKYARVAFPTLTAESPRRRIKRKYSPNPAPLPQWYPPKWKLRVPRALLKPQVNGTRWNA